MIFGYDFLRKRKFYKKVEENLSQLEEKYLLTELLDEPEFLEGQILCRVIQKWPNYGLTNCAFSGNIYRQSKRLQK